MQHAMESVTAQVESSLVKPWQAERSFEDALYEWMQRAPWLALSALAHALLFAILLAIPWDLLRKPEERSFESIVEQTEQEPFVEPQPEPEPVIEQTEPSEEPVLLSDAVVDAVDSESRDDPIGDVSDDLFSEFPAELSGELSEIGLGGGWSGGGGHLGGERGRPPPGRATAPALVAGLGWLSDHQAADGRWSSAGFMHENSLGRTCDCDGPGGELHDVGVTGLALLAFLGDGNTTRRGPYRRTVARGVAWLREQQDADSGLIGARAGHTFLYDHAIAALALCETWYFTRNPLVRRSAQQAVDFASLARNPYSAWRYSVPPNGESDTSITGWMVMLLKSAEEGGLLVDRTAYAGALSWLDEISDPATGRAGYTRIGSLSARMPGVNEHFPAEKGEAMTAVALLSRFLLGQEPVELGGDDEIMDRHAALLAAKLPEWDPDGRGNDLYYWYYGSYAMYQMGGARNWQPWRKALEQAVVRSQRRDGDPSGSWDPDGPWGMQGGRVYSTALMALTLEVHYRYARVIGGR